MRFERVEEKEDLERFNQVLLRRLRDVATRSRRQKLGYRSGQMWVDAFWVPAEKFWFATRVKRDHYWIAFGLDALRDDKALDIVVEVNTPRTPRHGRAGIFLRSKQMIFLAHSGRVGGGRPHINKRSFLRFYEANHGSVAEYGHTSSPAILLGELNDRSLLPRIGRFVRAVAAFKTSDPGDAGLPNLPTPKGKLFRPKFSGRVRYRTRGAVNAELTHDLVASELNRRLGETCRYTVHHDLFMPDRSGNPKVLFEIKTDTSTTSVYKGVGQLLINGHAEATLPKLVLVLPGTPSVATGRVLDKLRVRVLTYSWWHTRPRFAKPLPRFT